MSNSAQRVLQSEHSPAVQARRTQENVTQRVRENLVAATTEKARKEQEEREMSNYIKHRATEAKDRGVEILVAELQREIGQLREVIKELKQELKEADAKSAEKDEIVKQQSIRNLQQAATIKHQSALIQNPQIAIATPNNGRENMLQMSASYTAPPAEQHFYGNIQASRQLGKSLANRNYLNSVEQGSPEPRRGAAPQSYDHSRESSSSTNPYAPTPSNQRYGNSAQGSRPTTSSTHATTMSSVDNSKAVVAISDRDLMPDNDTLTKAFEKLYNMVERYACAHVNFVSNEKDGNMPQFVKQALLAAAAPANAFPFMGKPETRYHMVTKTIVMWLNKEILKGVSFGRFNNEVQSIIDDTRNKMFQGTPAVIKKMYMSDIASHVRKLLNAQGFKDFMQEMCRDQGNQLWKLVKPMMHQKTSNDWNDIFALMMEAHKLSIDMILSGNEFTFETVDIQSRFNPSVMISKDQSMMSIPPQDLVQRGAVVRLPITPKVLTRAYGRNGTTQERVIYRSTVLLKWMEVRQNWQGHHRS